MDKALIHKATLKARDLLMKEVWDLLRGVYGLDSKGKFDDIGDLPAVQKIPEVQETRLRLEKYLEDKEEAGQKRAKATEKLAREVAFTHLNRLVAFKMMEGRKLIRGTIDRHQSSNAFMFYLADNPEEMERYDAGNFPQDDLGEGPRDAAYRHFLLAESSKMAEEIRVLFDPDNLASRLFPRPRSLKDLIDLLNDPALEDAWAPDNEETIGWIYQYFAEDEKEAVFERLYKKKQKILPEDIPAATQLFTPRWIVKFLVENTLGREWVQMHPDSKIAEKASYLDYLVPLAGVVPPAPMKPVREIEVLDPACGTMHFGLVAFDLLAEMYKEEMARAGESGWPEKPSVESEDDISAAILANNIFGIDIALRAVQLSALALYLKAKTMNPKAKITESHLACAEMELPKDDSWLEEFFESKSISNPVYERVVRALWAQIKENSGKGAGSLLLLEDAIGELVATEKKRHQSTLQGLEDLAEMDPAAEKIEFWGEEFWEILECQVVRAFDEFAKEHDETFFAGEAAKGMRLLDIVRRRYDAVFTNPPYMTRRNMNSELAKFIAKNYPEGKSDLYTAFIERCLQLTRDEGRCGMITIHSFMFISSYEKLRKDVLDAASIETGCHLGTKTEFDISNPNAQGFVSFVLRRDPEKDRRSETVGTWYRLIKADGEYKRNVFEQAICRPHFGKNDPAIFRYRQGDFGAIPGGPWVYWITPGIRRLFEELPKLGEMAQPRVGLQTGNNFRFLRFWWEEGIDRVGFGCKNKEEAQVAGMKWFPYMKGGSFQRWSGNQEYVVNWKKDGEELRSFTPKSVIRNPDFYFRRGVTWSDLTSGRFSACLSPGGFIFDVKGSSAFPEDIPLVLALLNSSFSHFALNLLNPTVSFQVGDLSRLPIPKTSSDRIHDLVNHAISLAVKYSAEDEITFDFVAPAWTGSLYDTLTELYIREEALADVEAEIDEEVYRLYGISDEDRAAIEAELSEPENDGLTDEEFYQIDEMNFALRWVSYAVGIAMGRFAPGSEDGLGRGRFSPEVAEKLCSFADKDGVATLDKGHQDDLVQKVYSILEIALGEKEADLTIMAALNDMDRDLEKLLRRYIERNFFKVHLKKYRKRPVYWLLQSPKKRYSIFVFHEKATKDTLPLILGNRYVGGKINQLKNQIDEVRGALPQHSGGKKKRLEKELAGLEATLSDVLDFEAALRKVLETKDEQGNTVGWAPEIDDGVLLNLAPLHELMPSWKELKKTWKRLEDGNFDWSHTAMRYWPDRVLEKCKANKSYAIAHDRLDLYEGDR